MGSDRRELFVVVKMPPIDWNEANLGERVDAKPRTFISIVTINFPSHFQPQRMPGAQRPGHVHRGDHHGPTPSVTSAGAPACRQAQAEASVSKPVASATPVEGPSARSSRRVP